MVPLELPEVPVLLPVELPPLLMVPVPDALLDMLPVELVGVSLWWRREAT